jgi:hypothetical protein
LKKVFVFGYYSIKDPVFISATLNYLEQLSQRSTAYEFHMLTFEHDGFVITKQERKLLGERLKASSIIWYEAKWHTGGVLKPILKVYDLLISIARGLSIVRNQNCELIYSEGSVGSCISIFISMLVRRPHVVHSFEPHADSMLEGGVWRANSWEYILLKRFEKMVAKRSHTLITSTQAYKDVIDGWGFQTNVFVIPSCVDTSKFYFSPDDRKLLREEHGVNTNESIILYLGKFGGMYMEEELFQFFANCDSKSEINFRFWILTIENEERIIEELKRYGIPLERVLVQSVETNEVYKYLSAADCGIVAVRPLPAKRFCSPIKTGEYWSCGLPIVVPEGVGDEYRMVQADPELGLAIKELEKYTLEKVPERITNQSKIELRALKNYISKLDEILRVEV